MVSLRDKYNLPAKPGLVGIGQRLYRLRIDKGLSQHGLAAHVNVSHVAICKYESGVRYPSLWNLLELAKFFDVSLDLLVYGEELLIQRRLK